MQKQTPRLNLSLLAVLAGGFLLAAVAGCVNVVVIAEGGHAVTHVTGSITGISADLAHGVYRHAAVIGVIVAGFASGAAISGLLLGDGTLRFGRPYGIAIIIEGVLLALSGLLIADHATAGMALAAMGAGLQNGFASAYRGMVVRTTHVTGILTDLGFLAGCAIRHRRIAGWRFALLAGLLACFAGGGIVGALLYDAMGPGALLTVGLVLAASGGLYFLYRTHHRHTA